jgi:fucose permease
MLGPLLIGAMTSQLHWTTSFRAAGIAHLGIATWGLFVAFPTLRTEMPSEPVSSIPLLRSRSLAPFAAVAFAYVGVEAAMTIFAVPYANSALGLDQDLGRVAISGLWLGLFAGRMTTAAIPRPHGPGLIVASGVASGACLFAGVISASPQVVIVFAAVGFSLGCVYPVMIAGTGKQFPHAPGTAAGLAAGAGAVGGFFVPWLTGLIGDANGIAVGVVSVGVWCAAIALGGVAMARLPPPGRHGGEPGRVE